ncbi:MAG TPA: hypothetical protein PK317_00025 [Coprothermobacter proteolyticus]|nr:hypothetical protein [Coprothermobacter proteolyticus]
MILLPYRTNDYFIAIQAVGIDTHVMIVQKTDLRVARQLVMNNSTPYKAMIAQNKVVLLYSQPTPDGEEFYVGIFACEPENIQREGVYHVPCYDKNPQAVKMSSNENGILFVEYNMQEPWDYGTYMYYTCIDAVNIETCELIEEGAVIYQMGIDTQHPFDLVPIGTFFVNEGTCEFDVAFSPRDDRESRRELQIVLRGYPDAPLQVRKSIETSWFMLWGPDDFVGGKRCIPIVVPNTTIAVYVNNATGNHAFLLVDSPEAHEPSEVIAYRIAGVQTLDALVYWQDSIYGVGKNTSGNTCLVQFTKQGATIKKSFPFTYENCIDVWATGNYILLCTDDAVYKLDATSYEQIYSDGPISATILQANGNLVIAKDGTPGEYLTSIVDILPTASTPAQTQQFYHAFTANREANGYLPGVITEPLGLLSFELYMPLPTFSSKATFNDTHVEEGALEAGQLVSVNSSNYGPSGPEVNTYEEAEFQIVVSPYVDTSMYSYTGTLRKEYQDPLHPFGPYTLYYTAEYTKEVTYPIEVGVDFRSALGTGDATVLCNNSPLPARGIDIPGNPFGVTQQINALAPELAIGATKYLGIAFLGEYPVTCTFVVDYFMLSSTGLVIHTKTTAKANDVQVYAYNESLYMYNRLIIPYYMLKAALDLAISQISATIAGLLRKSEIVGDVQIFGQWVIPGAPTIYVVNEDAPDEASLERLSVLTGADLAPKERVQIDLLEEELTFGIGATISVGSEKYYVDSITYSGGWYKVSAWRPVFEQVYAEIPERKLVETLRNKLRMQYGYVGSETGNVVTISTLSGNTVTVPKSRVVVTKEVEGKKGAFWR